MNIIQLDIFFDSIKIVRGIFDPRLRDETSVNL
jgi:hypothetical protein